MALTQTIRRNPERFLATFLTVFGLLWLILEPAGLFFPQAFDWGWWGYSGLFIISLLVALIKSLPMKQITHTLAGTDTTITIKIADLFEQNAHLVIGANDVFDTELGPIINYTSVQGQFLMRMYGGKHEELDDEIDAKLQSLEHTKIPDETKTRGKNWRYPLGTTITLGTAQQRYFLCAYGRMSNDLRVTATADTIWHSLQCLWEQVRLHAHGEDVAIPVVGTSLARTQLPQTATISLIALSFMAASKERFVTKNLTIIIHRTNAEKVDFPALKTFFQAIRI